MNKLAKIGMTIAMSMILLSSCNDNNKLSPYDEILEKQPFSPLTDSINKDPQKDELWFRRAVLLNKNNFPEPALADFRKAWSLKKDERYAFGVSTILTDKKPDSAIAFLEDALKELPGSFLLQLSLARSYDAKGLIHDALKICDEILEKNPEQVDVLKMKADLLDKSDDPAAAISLLEKAYTITPFDVDLNYSLAFKYAENKNVKVVALCDSLIRVDSINLHAEPYYYKGIYYSNINDKAKAIAMFDLAIQRNYQYLNAYIEKASVLYEQKKYSEALKTAVLANTISPKFPDAWYWMGRCQEAMGDKDEAKLNYQRALGLDPDFTDAQEALQKIIN
ncbi:MAG: tetratricopeptide repeat protein [Chitinophagaceae bacterium]|nr:tetratricopeptide repeat protein [Chitinophagaceae bacterium]